MFKVKTAPRYGSEASEGLFAVQQIPIPIFIEKPLLCVQRPDEIVPDAKLFNPHNDAHDPFQ